MSNLLLLGAIAAAFARPSFPGQVSTTNADEEGDNSKTKRPSGGPYNEPQLRLG